MLNVIIVDMLFILDFIRKAVKVMAQYHLHNYIPPQKPIFTYNHNILAGWVGERSYANGHK